MPVIPVICSASRCSGLGHLYRGLALAGALRAQGARAPLWVADKNAASARNALTNAARVFSTVAEAAQTAAEQNAGAVVVDLHETELAGLERSLFAAIPLTVIDDLGAASTGLAPDIIISGHIFADAIDFSHTGCPKVLAGPRWFILRPDFVPGSTEPTGPHRLLLTFGGGETHHVERPVLEALARQGKALHGWETVLVLGAAYPYNHEELARNFPFVKIRTDVANMAELMRGCHAAVSAAGDTLYELAACGAATASVAIADNQVRPLDAFAQAGALLPLGRHPSPGLDPQAVDAALSHLLDPEASAVLARTARGLIDGRGAQRAAQEILRLE